MKKTLLYSLIALASLTGLTACDGDMEQPPMIVPTFELPEGATLMTIRDFKEMYWQSGNNYATLVAPGNEGQDIYIKGIVISKDETGNIFKNLYMEDETAGICFSIDSYDLYQTYYYGQEMYVKVNGLYAGRYSGLFEMGIDSGNSIGRVSTDIFNEHAHMNVKANVKVEPYVTTPTDLAAIKSQTAGLQEWQGRLITVENVYFEAAGQAFAPSSNSNRYVVDDNGGRLNVYCSTYSDFKDDIIPMGHGNVTGVLSYYNNDWQLLLNNLEGLQDFDGTENPSSGATGDALFAQAFKTAGQGGFIIDNANKPATVSAVWKYNDKYGMVATAYVDNTNYASESWLISPVFDLAAAKNVKLTFRHALNFFTSIDSAKTEATVWVSVDGAKWAQLSGINYPTSLGWDFVDSGAIDLAAYAGKKIQIGFRYASTASKAGTWEVDDFKLLGTGSITTAAATVPAK